MPSAARTATSVPPAISLPVINAHSTATNFKAISNTGSRPRSGSIVKVEQVLESVDDVVDQSMYRNMNTEWVNRKGAWMIHPVLILIAKVLCDTIPGITQELSWTFVNLLYMTFSYLMFHYVTGMPFDSDLHGGAYDDLTLWEQLDEGAQYTPSKKWLLCTPIGLFLASTHYTNYHPWLFAVNFSALLMVLLPKLPQLHGQRIRLLATDDISAPPTPTIGHTPPGSGSTTPRLVAHPLQ